MTLKVLEVTFFSGFTTGIKYNDVSGLFLKWNGCILMKMSFSNLLSKLNSHFNIKPDNDCIIILKIEGTHQALNTKVKNENYADLLMSDSGKFLN